MKTGQVRMAHQRKSKSMPAECIVTYGKGSRPSQDRNLTKLAKQIHEGGLLGTGRELDASKSRYKERELLRDLLQGSYSYSAGASWFSWADSGSTFWWLTRLVQVQ